ncbi:MAG: FMN-binding protein, partial [Rhodospirillales bacterium]|nr:FMN-binding protein [Rhodospirillales bacterium]
MAHCACTLLTFALAAVITLAAPGHAAAESRADIIAADRLQAVFPGANHAGRFEGTPPAAPVFKNGAVAGFLLSTFDTVGSTGYSGKPLDVLVGIDLQAVVTGAVLARHTEPILVIGVTDDQLTRFVAGFAGVDLRPSVIAARSAALPDAISGATVSSAVIRDAILRAGRAVARSRGLLGTASAVEVLDRETIEVADWPALLADGSIATARLTESRDGEDVLLLDLYLTLLTPPRIGESLLGKLAYNRLFSGLAADDHLILIAANGRASIKGTDFVRSRRFERLQIVQGEQTFPLTTDGYSNLEEVKAEGAPAVREIGVFTLRGAS